MNEAVFSFTSFCVFISLVSYVGVELLGQGTDVHVIFLNIQRVRQSGCTILHSHNQRMGVPSAPHPPLISFRHWLLASCLNIWKTEHLMPLLPPPLCRPSCINFPSYCRNRKDGVWRETAWIWSSALSLTSCGNLDELLHFFVSLFSHLWNGIIIVPTP